jgi:hypothetical protein
MVEYLLYKMIFNILKVVVVAIFILKIDPVGTMMPAGLMVIVVTSALCKQYHVTDNFINQAVLFVYVPRPLIPSKVT